jgi:hypothetical protein
VANDVEVRIIYTDKESADKLVKSAGDKGGEAGKNFGSGFSRAVTTAVGIGIFKAVDSAITGVKNQLVGTIDAARKLEVIETQFKTILGSTKAAQKQLADLQNFAASTPFQIEGLSNSTRQLLSFGVAQKDVIPTLQQLGDIASSVGADISDLTIPYGRLVSTQKLTLVELDKFADRGVNLYKKLSDQTGISLKNIRDEISKGRVPFEEFTKALGDLTSEGGMFFKGMEAQSKTLSGVISTLKDNFFNLQANIGAAFKPFIIAIISKITEQVQVLSKSVTNFVKNSENIQNIVGELFNFGDALINYVIKPLEIVGNLGTLVFSAVNTSVAALVAGVGDLGGAIGFLLQKTGLLKGVSQGLLDFQETSNAVLQENATQTKEAFNGLFDTSFSENLNTRNEEFRNFLTNVVNDSQVANETIKMQNQETAESIKQSTVTAADGIVSLLGSLRLTFTSTQENLNKTAKQIAGVVKNNLVRGISGGIQNIVNSIAKGEDAFANFGKFVLQTIGDLAIQMGQTLLAAGIGIEALKGLGGSAAIAAGAGLIALGAVIKAIAGGGGSTSSSTSTGGSNFSGGAGGEATLAEDIAAPESIQESGPRVALTIEGNVFDTDDTRKSIVTFLNEEFSESGASLENASFA